ncbi:hypothetical protein AG1IA_01874 [Rhizoctonia solani AG-1 IA]|uniref:Uncharacterized protein n=1 Tax=Thanatephorus cucumeris (strain AG1-IA) TaxID=983506 RepID=L8X178_THACA|nr:hypothetical protein AG1IA_01874 [Rhizoctonia solani AG-1 IA]
MMGTVHVISGSHLLTTTFCTPTRNIGNYPISAVAPVAFGIYLVNRAFLLPRPIIMP